MKKMKILILNSTLDSGSTGRLCSQLQAFLEERNVDVFRAYSVGKKINSIKYYKIGNLFDRKTHALLSRMTGNQLNFSFIATFRFLKYVKDINPNIIFINNIHANYINFKLLFSYLRRKKIHTVITFHDCWFYTGKCCYYTIAECNKWKNKCEHCPQLNTERGFYLFDRTSYMQKVKKQYLLNIEDLNIICVSNWLANEARNSFLTRNNSIRVIYNWIDLNTFTIKENKIIRNKRFENKKVILSVASSWTERKGLDKIISVSKLSSDEYIFVIIGKTNKTISNNKVFHVPNVSNVKELVYYYNLADVFLNLSLEETFGLVTAEALACGTPVVALDSTATSELITKRTGFLLPPTATSKQIFNTINSIKKKKYSFECRKFAEQHFNFKKNCNQYLELFETIVKEKSGV